MKIFYRVSPFLSSHPNPLGEDKYKIVVTCLQSFLRACNFPNHQIVFVCDSVPDQWMNQISPYGKVVEAPHGNVETFHTQLDLVVQEDDEEKILICEDDYLWLDNTLDDLATALDTLPFVSPYDHPSHYLEERFDKHYETRLIGGRTYRRAPSNTLTFACKAKEIKNRLAHMKSFGINDHEMWQGLELWNPCYSMATHCVSHLLAPNIDWHVIINKS